jgi:hypothetical protein
METICAICTKEAGTMVCKCVSPEVVLCNGCIGAHYEDHPTAFHYMIPVMAREFV